jgi:hypothetical protein
MSRLRRQSHCAHSLPIAAEVLEVRSLLSAGVHAAVAHAQHEVHTAAAQTVPVVVFPVDYHASLMIQGTLQGQAVNLKHLTFDGLYHGKPSAAIEVGKSVKISINQTINRIVDGVQVNSVKGAITGKVTGIAGGSQGAQTLTITPSGHITASLKIAGKNVNVTLSANSASPLSLSVDGSNNFEAVSGQYQVTKPTGSTGTAKFLITQVPV